MVRYFCVMPDEILTSQVYFIFDEKFNISSLTKPHFAGIIH